MALGSEREAGGAVLCCGNLVYDTLVRPVDELRWGGTTFVESIEYHAGGNGANTSHALAILGVPVRLLGAVGQDAQGQFILDVLRGAGVDTSGVERVREQTSATVGIVNGSGERKFFHRMGASREAFAQPLEFTPELCSGVVHFHLASFLVLPRMRTRGPEPLIQARAAGMSTSFDTNWDPEGGWMETLAPCLPYIDYLFMNEDEARMITGTREAAVGAKVVLEKGLKTAVMKLGPRGCAIYTDEREILCPAFELEARDSTGAGDCFAAGFVAAVVDGAGLEDAGRFANAVGALSVQKVGAVTGVMPRAETEAWMKTAKLGRASAVR